MLNSPSTLKIISIVPKLPPAIGGVGDYALCLAEQMKTHTGIETHFIVADPNWSGPSRVEGFAVTVLPERSAGSLSDALHCLSYQQPQILVMHLSGYGYAKWSMYHWLISGLKLWKQSCPESLLLTMFHELYCAYGKPWKHSFWTSALQRRLASSLAILSDASLTNCVRHSNRISTLSQGKHVHTPVLPIFSSMGEPNSVPPIGDRQQQLVIFGGTVTRRRAYESSLIQLSKLCKQYGILRIIDIGKRTGIEFETLSLPPVLEMGCLSSDDISELLLESAFGWLSYENRDIEKSSVLASYCAHGVVPIIHTLSPSIPLNETTREGAPRLLRMTQDITETDLSVIELQALSDEVFTWYRGHNVASHAIAFLQKIEMWMQVSEKTNVTVTMS